MSTAIGMEAPQNPANMQEIVDASLNANSQVAVYKTITAREMERTPSYFAEQIDFIVYPKEEGLSMEKDELNQFMDSLIPSGYQPMAIRNFRETATMFNFGNFHYSEAMGSKDPTGADRQRLIRVRVYPNERIAELLYSSLPHSETLREEYKNIDKDDAQIDELNLFLNPPSSNLGKGEHRNRNLAIGVIAGTLILAAWLVLHFLLHRF